MNGPMISGYIISTAFNIWSILSEPIFPHKGIKRGSIKSQIIQQLNDCLQHPVKSFRSISELSFIMYYFGNSFPLVNQDHH